VIVVHTPGPAGPHRAGHPQPVHELAERGAGSRNLADPIRVDSSDPADPMAQLAVVLLALFGQMERTCTFERAAHARAVATGKGRRVDRPVVLDPAKLAWAAHLRDTGHSIAEVVATTGIARTSLYRHLPPQCVAEVLRTLRSYAPRMHDDATVICLDWNEPTTAVPAWRRDPRQRRPWSALSTTAAVRVRRLGLCSGSVGLGLGGVVSSGTSSGWRGPRVGGAR